VAAIAFLIGFCSTTGAVAQTPAAVQVSARVIPLDTIQVAVVRHFAAGEKAWQPVPGTTLADVHFEAVADVPSTEDAARRSRRVVVSYIRD
jgi:hypothetical protein